jgi:Tol biopolymer transport system component
MDGTASALSRSATGRPPNLYSLEPTVSDNGRYIAFSSFASDLVGGDTNGSPDVFVRDRWTGRNIRVSVSDAGRQGNTGSDRPVICADGSRVAFTSRASHLVRGDTNRVGDVFVRDLAGWSQWQCR